MKHIQSESVKKLYARMNPCMLCPHHCGINRQTSTAGKCTSGMNLMIASHTVHFGEEPAISGFNGSGTIFFSGCNLSCVFCQNYPISQLNNGNLVSVSELANIMLDLQKKKVHNINCVTPTHYAAHIAEAVAIARDKGLRIPLVYNSGGYEDVDTLKLLEGVFDIYMPDAKYFNPAHAEKYSDAENYHSVNCAALKEMYRQVGHLVCDNDGIARRGLLVRHLVLPNNIAGSADVLKFIAKDISPDTYVSIMAQYHPAHRAEQHPELFRRVSKQEYARVMKAARTLKLENGWRQEL